MSHWFDSLTAWLGAHPQWLGVAVLLIACTECLAIAGLVVPGTVLLFAVCVLAGNGALGLWETLVLAYCGGLAGDLLSYLLGRRFHQNIRRLPLLRDRPHWLDGAERYFHRYGVVSLLVGRFVGPLRPMLPMVAGMVDMPFGRFLAVSLVASAGWSVAYILPGWAAGAALRLPLPDGFWTAAGIVAVALLAAVALIAHGSLGAARHASARAAALCLLLLGALLLGWPYLDSLDRGLMALVQEHRQPVLDSAMVLITRAGDYWIQVATGVLLCAILLCARRGRALLFAGCTLLGTALANGALKHLFARARPDVLSEPLTSFSLPSGHSSAAFAFFLTLGVLAGREQAPRLRLAWMLLAGLPPLAIALSRVYLGAHWPTDVIAGTLLAGGVCAASLSLVQRQAPLPGLSARLWWLILPACLALLALYAGWSLPEAMARYRAR